MLLHIAQSQFYCAEKTCPLRGSVHVLPFRNCGNTECCKGEGTHYPLCSCGKVMTQVTRTPGVIWTGNIGKRYRDPKLEGYHGDSAGEDGFWAWGRKNPSGKPKAERIETWQQAKEFAKREGLVDPREMPTNSEVSEDGKRLLSAGMPGQEI